MEFIKQHPGVGAIIMLCIISAILSFNKKSNGSGGNTRRDATPTDYKKAGGKHRWDDKGTKLN